MSKEKPLRILQVHNLYQIHGGEDVVVENEKRILESKGHTVVTYYRNNTELNKLHGFKKLTIPFTAIFSLKTYREVKALIKENQIDLVHVHNTLMMISPSVFYAAFSCKVPVIQTLHNFRMLCPAGSFFRDSQICEECAEHGLQCALKHGCYRGSKAQTFVSAAILKIHRILGTYRKVYFICLTEFNKEKILMLNQKKKHIIDTAKMYIKPNFAFENEKKHLEKEDKINEYLFVGRVEALKGIDVAAKAFEQLPDKKLIVAGDGPMMPEMRQYVKEHQIKNVIFAGYQTKDELEERYRNAKALVMSSQCYETFALSIAEAYSFGTPVIAGEIGNLSNMVQENVTGLKFKYNSSEDLAEKIKQLDTLDLIQLGENARHFYEQQFLPERNYQILYDIYCDVLSKNKKSDL